MGINEQIRIGSKIKSVRKKRGYKQKDVAEWLNIPVSTYANYEADRREPTFKTVLDISALLNVPFTFFLQDDFTNPDEWNMFEKKKNEFLDSKDAAGLENFLGLESGSIIDIGINPESLYETKLLGYFRILNPIGKEEATKRIEELTHIDKYTEEE